MSSSIAALGGIVFASLLGPSLSFGQGLLLPAFAAAFLGSTQLRPGRFNVGGTMIAIYVLATGVQGFAFVTRVQWLSDMFNGVALVVAVAFAVWRQNVAGIRQRATGTRGGGSGDSAAGGPTGDQVLAVDDRLPQEGAGLAMPASGATQ